MLRTFLASFSAFKRNFSSFFRFSAEYSFRLFSFIIFSLIFLLHSFDVEAVLAALLLLPSEMTVKKDRDVDDDVDDAAAGDGVIVFDVGFALDEVDAAAAADIGVFCLLFAVVAVCFATAVDDDDFGTFAGANCLADVELAMRIGGLSVGDTNARVLSADFDLIGATFAVIPNFETADGVLVDIGAALPNSNGTVSRDDVDDADFDFCDVYEANLGCVRLKTNHNCAKKTI